MFTNYMYVYILYIESLQITLHYLTTYNVLFCNIYLAKRKHNRIPITFIFKEIVDKIK